MYDEIIADEYQIKLMAYKDSLFNASFQIGDICNEILVNDPVHEKALIYKAIALYAGKSARTIREYSAVSAFYDHETRIAFEVLSYDHFRIAMRYKDRWSDALRWCISQVDEMNRPATVDAMVKAFGVKTIPEEIRILSMVDKIQAYVHDNVKDPGLISEFDISFEKLRDFVRLNDSRLLINIL